MQSQIKAWLAELTEAERKLIEEIQLLAQETQAMQVLEMLYHNFDLLTQRVQALLPEIPCDTGCFRCCEAGEPQLYPVEAELLEDMYPEALQLEEGRPEGPCPLLKEGRCSVYAARPLHCRAMGYAFHKPERALPILPPQPWSCSSEQQRIQQQLQHSDNPVRYMYLPLLNQYRELIAAIDGPPSSLRPLSAYADLSSSP